LYTTQQCVVAAFVNVDDVFVSLIFAPFFVVITYGIHHVSTYGIFAKNSSDGEKAKRRDLVSPLVPIGKPLTTGATPPQSATKHRDTNMVRIANTTGSGRESGSEEQPPARPVVEATEITFNRLLGKDESLHLFMVHLSTEFNMECLLAYIEFTQFQSFVLEHYEVEIVEDFYHLVPFPRGLPISSIVAYVPVMMEPDGDHVVEVEAEDELHSLKIKGRLLFLKYLCPGCQYECNISSRLRSRAVRMFRNQEELLLNKDITAKSMFMLFEDVKNELIRFLRPSFYAFKHTPCWKVIMAICLEDDIQAEEARRLALRG